MKETVYKYLDKKYPDYASLVKMDSDPYEWIKHMFGLGWAESDDLYDDWCTDRFNCIITIAIYPDGSKIWNKNGEPHRDNDLPSVKFLNGYKAWYQHGERHRDGGKPAIIQSNGRKTWHKNGTEYTPKINKI